MTFEDAFKLVQSIRPNIYPNEYFKAQLKEYEKRFENNNKIEHEEIKEEVVMMVVAEKKKMFRCKHCRTELFKCHEIIHGSQEKKCTSYFIEKPTWIEGFDQESKLYCFNKKCSQKIGEINLSGNKCSCGNWVAPCYQVHKNKIDFLEI